MLGQIKDAVLPERLWQVWLKWCHPSLEKAYISLQRSHVRQSHGSNDYTDMFGKATAPMTTQTTSDGSKIKGILVTHKNKAKTLSKDRLRNDIKWVMRHQHRDLDSTQLTRHYGRWIQLTLLVIFLNSRSSVCIYVTIHPLSP